MGVGGQRHGRFTPGFVKVRKILLPPGFKPPTLQPLASRYTDWAIQANRIRLTMA
jgi:hypothetical protein